MTLVLVAIVVEHTFLKIQIHKSISFFLSLYRSRRKKWSTVQIFFEEFCGDAQDLSSPDDEDEPLLSNSRGFTSIFSNFEAII